MALFNSKTWLLGTILASAVVLMTHAAQANAFEGHLWGRDVPHSQTQLRQRQGIEVGQQEAIFDAFELQRYSQSQSRNLRSRSDVIREVKQRYPNAEILRISLDERAMIYRVRVLTSGKVKNVKVSARK